MTFLLHESKENYDLKMQGHYQKSLLNAMTVDVEEYFQVYALSSKINRDDWAWMTSRVVDSMQRILDLFSEHNVKATFFTLGWVAERHPELIKQMVARGHEIASHSYDHQRIDTMDADQFREDARKSKQILEDISGQKVKGYRAPTFSIGHKTPWFFEILAEEGYMYSSSIYPVQHDLYGMPDGPKSSYRPRFIEAPFLEIPMTVMSVFGKNLPVSGGGYFRLMPYPLFQFLTKRARAQNKRPNIFYFHPWEVDPAQPHIHGLPLKAQFRHYYNLGMMEEKLKMLCRDFEWDRMDKVFQIGVTDAS